MPETLLSLYQNSDSIHIARFDKTEDGEVSEDTPDYTAISIKKHFSISSSLKGESRKFFVLDEVDYRYKNTGAVSEGPDESEEMEDEEGIVPLEPGDSLLLFLKKSEDGEDPKLTDYRDGTKKLSTEEIGVYEARIKELNSIFAAEKVEASDIVQWLIRCAEDPATRWEGTFELLQSAQNMEWQEKSAQELKEKIARGEVIEPEDAGAEQSEELFETGSIIFAKMLDANQKQALSDLLLNGASANAEGEEESRSIRGDAELVELVQRWGDARLPTYLLEQLRNSSDAYAVSELMNSISAILDDQQASSLAERYSEIAYEEDSGEVETENEPENEASADVDSQVNSITEDSENDAPAASSFEDEAVVESEREEPKKLTYKEVRQDILARFLERCEKVLAKKPQVHIQN
ncbi:MAG: hypothetical protein H7070_03225 [Saprospiraceae bacterium]|nr:hypothetical protein [Pyrinomonadaceae bacterium]